MTFSNGRRQYAESWKRMQELRAQIQVWFSFSLFHVICFSCSFSCVELLFLWLFHFLFLFSTKHVRDDFMALDFIYYQIGIILTKCTLLVFIVAKKLLVTAITFRCNFLLTLWRYPCFHIMHSLLPPDTWLLWNRVLFLSPVLYFLLLRLSSNLRILWRKSVKLQVVGLSSPLATAFWQLDLFLIYILYLASSQPSILAAREKQCWPWREYCRRLGGPEKELGHVQGDNF